MVLAHNIQEKDRTKDVQISRDVTFESMLLSSQTLNGLKESGFYRPSPVQLLGIPLGKCGFDLLLEAKSGTGKTAVFSVIALEKIDLDKGLQVIILAPTREIAAQICDVLKQIGSKYERLSVDVVMGGLPVQDDINKFNKNNIHIVVGSPGRLKHLISDKHINVSSVRLLVLDEADKLMEKSFITDIKYIYSSLPTQKQVIMSSATYPESSKEFIDKFVYSAQHVCPNSNSVLLGVVQKITRVQYNSNIVKQTYYRFNELIKILSKIQFKQCLIFCNYQTRVAELHKMLTKNKWPAEQLHGQQDQIDRLDALKTLQEYKCRILISTDLASRGIDASNIDLVINFEPPFEWQTYLHRIGRAGRFGSYGTAITILSEGTENKKFMNIIESLNAPFNNLWSYEDIKDQSHMDLCSPESVISKEIESCEGSELSQSTCLNDKSKNRNSLESFDQLCSSFNISNNEQANRTDNIQSFPDLLRSFENIDNVNEENNSQYLCLSIPDKPQINVVKVKSKNNVSTNENIDLSKVNTDDKIVINEKQPKERTKENIGTNVKTNGNSCLSNNEANNFLMSKTIVNNDNLTEKLITAERIDNLDNNELGLPTAFMSSKDKKRNDKSRCHDKHHEPVKLWSYQNFQSKNNAASKLNAKKEPNNYHKNRDCDKYFSSDSDLSDKSTALNRIGNDKSNVKAYNLNSRKIHFSENVQQPNIDKYVLAYRRDEHLNNNYYNWYNRLKLQTKQIEMAIYIKELSEF